TTHTNAGTYTGDAWTFTDAAGNYNDASGAVNDSIGKANAVIIVSGYTGVYDGAAHGATGSAAAGGANLTSLLNFGASFSDVPGGTAHWTFAGNANYAPASGDVSITITRRTLTVTADNKSKTYGGANPALTASYSGFVNGETETVLSG